MNYYNEIKNELINNEITKRVKDFSKNRSDLNTYYNVGKLLADAGKHYGEGIIKEYSKRLTNELGKGYGISNLKTMRKFYYFSKSHAVRDLLTWTHYKHIMTLKNDAEIEYYENIVIKENLTERQLREKIKNKEYERLDNNTKNKLITKEETNVKDFIKNPILIKNIYNYEDISEKILQKLIIDNIDDFLKELGTGFSYIGSEYKIKIGCNYNYIDLLLFNIEYNCYVVIELKVTPLKKEHIGQIEVYMNYIDNNLKKMNQDKTIGIIICKKDNKFIMEYCSDPRIISREYELI